MEALLEELAARHGKPDPDLWQPSVPPAPAPAEPPPSEHEHESDSATVRLARPWSKWLHLPPNDGERVSGNEWAILSWFEARRITVPLQMRVFGEPFPEAASDNPSRLLSAPEKKKLLRLARAWSRKVTGLCNRGAEAAARIHRHRRAESIVSRTPLTELAASAVASGVAQTYVNAVLSGAGDKRDEESSLRARWGLLNLIPEKAQCYLVKPIPCLPLDDSELLPYTGAGAAAGQPASESGAAAAPMSAMQRKVLQLRASRSQPQPSVGSARLLMARQRLAMTLALREWGETSARRYLKRWGYKTWPKPRSTWKSRVKIWAAAICELLEFIAEAHTVIDPRALKVRLVQRAAVEEDMMSMTRAIRSLDVGVVKRILGYGLADPNAMVPRQGYRCMHLAVVAARYMFQTDRVNLFDSPACMAMVECLSEWGTNVNLPDEQGATPLHYAAILWDEVMLRYLHKMGGCADATDKQERQLVHYVARLTGPETACCSAAPECVPAWALRITQLLEDQPPLDYSGGQVPAGFNVPDMLKCVKEIGGDIDAVDRAGRTAFHGACSEHILFMVKALVEFGANTDLSPADNESPCAAALKYNWDRDTGGEKVVKFLLDGDYATLESRTASGWPFFLVAFTAGIETMGLSDDGHPLMRNEDLLNMLLASGCSLDMVVPAGDFPETSAFLLACGMSRKICNQDCSFIYDPSPDLIQWLLDRNASMSVSNRLGQTGLWFACRGACFECHCGMRQHTDCVCGKGTAATKIVAYLVEHGADVDLPDIHGITPFHTAAIHGQIAVVKYLLECTKANSRTPDYFGCSPRDAAMMRGFHSIVDLIDKKHRPSRIMYEGSLSRGDTVVTKIAGAFVTPGLDALTREDYRKAEVSFKVALAKLQGHDILPSSGPDLCWALAYTHFRMENVERASKTDNPPQPRTQPECRWMHSMILRRPRAPIIQWLDRALKHERAHFLTLQTVDYIRTRAHAGVSDDSFLRMLLDNSNATEIKHRLSKETPQTFAARYGQTLCTPLYLAIQYSLPHVFKLVLETTGDWIIGGQPHHSAKWGAESGEKERSIAWHELYHWLPQMSPLEVGELRLAHGWCPVTVTLTSVAQRKECTDMLRKYISEAPGRTRAAALKRAASTRSRNDGTSKALANAQAKEAKAEPEPQAAASESSSASQPGTQTESASGEFSRKNRRKKKKKAKASAAKPDSDAIPDPIPEQSAQGADVDSQGCCLAAPLTADAAATDAADGTPLAAVKAALARAGVPNMIPAIEEVESSDYDDDNDSNDNNGGDAGNGSASTVFQKGSGKGSAGGAKDTETSDLSGSVERELERNRAASDSLIKQLRAEATKATAHSAQTEKILKMRIGELEAEVQSLRMKQHEVEAHSAKLSAESARRDHLQNQLVASVVDLRRQLTLAAATAHDPEAKEPSDAAPRSDDEAKIQELVRSHSCVEAASAVRRELVNVSDLPALYASAYGRHRSLSLPSWDESLAELRNCHVVKGMGTSSYVFWCG